MSSDQTQAADWPWPAPVDDGCAKHLIAGTRLPDVALPATRGASVNLARYQERAIVFIYPMTGTPGVQNPAGWDNLPGAHGSTPEAEGFRDCYAEFELLRYEVFGVSAQSPAAQETFAARAGIPYLLLSDEKLEFADALRLPRFEIGGETYLKRLTMIVRDGVIYRVIYPVHPPATHARELLQSLSQARA
ncbi:peroxiredoxin [Hyphomicrobium sp.]|uniref:peroxiredoxin n=1 Tax=Hyphomicrobium sp. TaxID=82 RepID=UPI002D0D8692|nr:peroxiredoxin [Hyphomicrobium sp.]HVZ04529.1 peroxiredoxin [Hyphomicrobium sp.]